jgi:hypothetical protein
LEALFLGAYELVSKIGLILAVPEGLRTVEHVRWAFALVKRDIEEKVALVTANDREKDDPATALAARILSLCGGDDGETIGVLRNRMRKSHRPEDVDSVVSQLVTAGRLVQVAPTKRRRGPNTDRYRKK